MAGVCSTQNGDYCQRCSFPSCRLLPSGPSTAKLEGYVDAKRERVSVNELGIGPSSAYPRSNRWELSANASYLRASRTHRGATSSSSAKCIRKASNFKRQRLTDLPLKDSVVRYLQGNPDGPTIGTLVEFRYCILDLLTPNRK